MAPNDLVVVGGQLYVSNDHGFRGVRGFLETITGLGFSNVVHFNGTEWREAVTGLAFANGVEANSAGTRLYVAATRNRKIYEYARDPLSGNIEGLTNTFRVRSGVDNLIWEDANNLLVAAHPRGLAFLRHASNPERNSPSEVYRVNVVTGESQLLYRNAGDEIDAASTAALYRGRLYMGQVFDPEILSCNAP